MSDKPKFITIAVDFDGTIIKGGQYPNADPGAANLDAIYCLKKLAAHPKIKLILWSCRDINSGKTAYNNMMNFCKTYDLKFDAVNDNLQEYKDQGFACRKIFANIYIDDLAISRPPITIHNPIIRDDKMNAFWKAFRNIVGTPSGLEFWILDMINSI